MFKWVDHVIVAVSSLDQAIPTYEKILGKKVGRTRDLTGQGVRAVDFFLDQGRYFELIEPLSPDSAVAKGIARRGEGVYCLAMAVDDAKKEAKELKDKGVPLIEFGGLYFIHPKASHGVLIQLAERK